MVRRMRLIEATDLDITSVGSVGSLGTITNPVDVGGSALPSGAASEATLVSLLDSALNAILKNNEALAANGNSANQNILGAKHVDVLISVGTPTGSSPTIQFYLDVMEETSSAVIRTYNGTLLSAAGVDYITVDGLTLGQYVRVRWVLGGTTPSFPNCYVRLIAKR
ncbi:MAG: hypothetical protein M8353_03265 [ANME-2 cluster archaeon]|nr:hypothetical protein [ANME-2 cluster archaeon]